MRKCQSQLCFANIVKLTFLEDRKFVCDAELLPEKRRTRTVRRQPVLSETSQLEPTEQARSQASC